MIKQTAETINTIHGILKFKYENIDLLDLIESTECIGKCCQQSKFRTCPNCRLSYIKNLKYYLKNKLANLKLQTVYYKPHFKKSCFNCSSSFHGSRFEDGHFNLQKMFDVGNKCDICIKNYTKERSFYHACNICNASFKNCNFLKHHHRSEHNSKKPHQCAACHLSLSDGALFSHINKHKLLLVCPHCNKRCARKSYLKAHILSHSGVNQFSCKYCPKHYTSKHGLNVHLFEHTGDKKFECEKCNKTFATQHLLKRHKLTHREKNIHIEKSFQCKYCPKQYKVKHSLDAHLFEHIGGKQFKCDLCEKTFAKQYLLNQHKYSHVEQFQCEYCPEKFKTKHGLYLHQLEHTSDKKFQCDLCDKTFVKQHLLNRHKVSHMGKLFQCNYCLKQYKSKRYLDIHLYEHASVKQFKCDLCDKSFAEEYMLNQHISVHTGEPFQCTVCSKLYKTSLGLSWHNRSVHMLQG